jgi:hypothetical protein
MTIKPHTSASHLLYAAAIALTNTSELTDIKTTVAEYGYTTARLAEGQALYRAAEEALAAQRMALGDKKIATADMLVCGQLARDAYVAAVKVARATLDDGQLATLGIEGKLPTRKAGLIQAGYTLFDNLAATSLLQDYGYTPGKIAAERAKIAAYEEAANAQRMAKGAAEQATQDRQAAMASLQDWLAQYIKIARVALRDRRELLEQIGVKVRARRFRVDGSFV